MSAAAKKKLTVRLKKGLNKRTESHKSCVHGLGLRRIGQTAKVEDSPAVRGMIGKVSYLVEIVKV
ncbi:MAG: 50S ribosomal protein L30 [Gammaproteobacteria bacterium]|nr:50S ribosomal protein L30 [Gammaproteobacteria bacterium]